MDDTSPLSTIIDTQVKEAVTEYCKSHGIKIRYFIERALVERLDKEKAVEAGGTRMASMSPPRADASVKLNKKKKKKR